MKNIIKKMSLLVACAFLLSACLPDKFTEDGIDTVDNPPPPPPPKENPVRKPDVLHKTENCSDFKSYLTQNLIEQYLDNQNRSWGLCSFCSISPGFVDDGFESSPLAGGAPGSATGTTNPGSVTGTNNQEAGVDELDTVKTDAEGNMFLVENETLFIIDAYPPENMNIIAQLNLGSHALGLFLDEMNDQLIVLTREWVEKEYLGTGLAFPSKYTVAKINLLFIDVADLTIPQITETIKLDGSFTSARFIGQRLHLVMDHRLRGVDESFATRQFNEDLNRYWQAKNLGFESLEADIAKLRAELSAQIEAGVATLELDKVMPMMTATDDADQLLLQCNDIYHPEVSLKTGGMISVVSVDSDAQNFSSVGTFASGGIVYATLDALYLAQGSSGWWWSSDDQQTVIHAFRLGETETIYAASGAVAGLVNNQFSMSQHKDHLRVATTERHWPADAIRAEQYNHMFILKESAGGLEITGSVEKFAPDERIFSARYLGDRAFVVTFRNTDPLFAFDLSDPENPRITGELHIPGFSTYMHPIDENHLLTIGEAGNEFRATGETQLQIFDISDMQAPKRIAAHIPQLLQDNQGWGYSIAESDHHAFTYSANDGILAIPLSFYNWESDDSFAGIATFKIDVNAGISENGMVDHSDFVPENECSKPVENAAIIYDQGCIRRYYSRNVQPKRSVIMQDEAGSQSYLFSISSLGVKANKLHEMEVALSQLPLKESSGME